MKKLWVAPLAAAMVLANAPSPAGATSVRVVGGQCAIHLDNEIQYDVARYLTSIVPMSESHEI